MELCEDCTQQRHASATSPEHAHMQLIDPGPLTQHGWEQTWLCKRCETVWVRINTSWVDTPHRWTVLAAQPAIGSVSPG